MRIWRYQNPHTSLGGIRNGAATLESSLAITQMVKHRIPIYPSNSVPRYVPKIMKTPACKIKQKPKNHYMYFFHSSIIHNNTKSENNPNVHQLTNG